MILLTAELSPSQFLLERIAGLREYADIDLYIQPLGKTAPKVAGFPCLPYAGEGIAQACNAAAAVIEAEMALFLAAGLEPEHECRLEQLLELAARPHIALAGGSIWHKGRLVNGGWAPDATGLPFPLLQGMSKSEVSTSAWGQMKLPRHVLGAPWQCMAVKRKFCANGTFLNESFGALATVDFGLRAMAQNKFIAMNPWVNWQTATAEPCPDTAALKYIHERWGTEIAECGLRNPNLRAAPDNDWTLILD